MAEITPIAPYPPIIGLRKIDRDEKRKSPPQQQNPKSKSNQETDQPPPVQHIDEIV